MDQNRLDEISRSMFNTDFSRLSEFAKDTVRRAAGQQIQLGTNLNTEVSITRKLAELEQQNITLRRENEDLWEENEELKLQLYEREDADNSSRST